MNKTHRFTALILEQLTAGNLDCEQIAKDLGCTAAAVWFHRRRLFGGVVSKTARYDWKLIQEKHDAGMTRLELMKEFGFSEPTWTVAVRRGDIKPISLRIPIEQFLQDNTKFDRENMRRRLINEGLLKEECNRCGILKWNDLPIRTQLHHKNGRNTDNRLDNLELLCPNCHSQTDTYMGKNSTRAILKKKLLGLPHPNMDRLDAHPDLKLKGPWKKPKRPGLGRKAPLNPLNARAALTPVSAQTPPR